MVSKRVKKLFYWAGNLTFIAQHWVCPGTESSVIYKSRNTCFTIECILV